MSLFQKMVDVQLVFLIYILIGYVGKKLNVLDHQDRARLTVLLMNIVFPCMVLTSFSPDLMTEMRSGLMAMGLICAGIIAASVICALIFRRQPPAKRPVMIYGSAFSNTGCVGLPMASMLFSEVGLFYASMMLLASALMVWTLGISFYAGTSSLRQRLKMLVTPTTVSILAGIALMLLGIYLPSPLFSAFKNVGAMAAPLTMMIVGISLAELPLSGLISRDAVIVSLLRVLAVPLLSLALFSLFRIDSTLLAVAVIMTMGPPSSTTAIWAESYGADTHLAARCVAISSILSLFVTPLITLLLN